MCLSQVKEGRKEGMDGVYKVLGLCISDVTCYCWVGVRNVITFMMMRISR